MLIRLNPLISIIIPCYNQGEFINDALKSTFLQTYTNWECIIIDDGSTDNTEKITNEWLKKDNRFIYLKKENGGLSSARNLGLRIAKGEWIQFLDSDDYIKPEKFKISLASLIDKPSIDIIVSNFMMFTKSYLEPTKAFCILDQNCLTFNKLLFGWDDEFNIPIHCGLFKRTLFADNLFVEYLKAKEDWIMWLKLLAITTEIIYLDKPLAYYRINPYSMTQDKAFVRENLIEAYKYLLQTLPEENVQDFTFHIIKRFYNEVTHYEEEVTRLKNKRLYKFESEMKNVLRKYLKKINF